MHRHGLAIATLLGSLFVGLSGCALVAPRSGPVRHVYVEEAVGAPATELARHAAAIHDSAVRTLRGLGYAAALEPADADAFLRAAWSVQPASAGAPHSRVSLRMTLVARDGTLLRAADIIRDVPAGFLTDEGITEQVRVQLGAFAR